MGVEAAAHQGSKVESYRDSKRKDDVRINNIVAAQAVANAVRTSLGPRGMDKMIQTSNGEVIITNDGATILKRMEVEQPAAKMLVELSESQDVVAGDGTTSVVVLCGSLLGKALSLLQRGIHPTLVSDSLHKAAIKGAEILTEMATPVTLDDRDELLKSASTSLNSKVVSHYSGLLAPIAVDSVLRVIDPARPDSVDLKDIKVVRKVGGTVDDTHIVEGLVFDQKASKAAGGPTIVKDAKIGLIQFQISPPKTDLENNVIVSDYTQMDRILKEERNYILAIVKKIRAAGCNVLLIQKSILRDAVTDLALHYLAKAKIMVVKDIERDEIEFISKTLNCLPIASIEHFKAEKLGKAALVEEVKCGSDGKIVQVTGIEDKGNTMTVLVRGSNKLVLDEAERSLHGRSRGMRLDADALCVVRCLVNKRYLIAGGGAPEIELSVKLQQWAKTLQGVESVCVKAWAEALEVIPYTLAENAGLNPIEIVTELRNLHAQGKSNFGINVRKGTITNILEENVVQPLLVTTSALSLASECVRMILKIDDGTFEGRDMLQLSRTMLGT
eukprot:scaffold1904_cov375-Prasinococcus_capsulatus_cf.AAC.3